MATKPKTRKFKPEMHLKVYKLFRSGLDFKSVAKVLGVSVLALNQWRKDMPAIQIAMDEGKKDRPIKSIREKTTVDKFHDFVFQELPEELQELWNEINDVETTRNGIQRLETMIRNNGKRAHQQLFIYALSALNFDFNKACRTARVTKVQLDKWVAEDHNFPKLLDTITWHKKNYFESALMDLVARGDASAILMVNRSINRDRGYNDKLELSVNGKIAHEHKHVHVVVDDLNLPMDTRKEILAAMRGKAEDQRVIESNGHKITSIQ